MVGRPLAGVTHLPFHYAEESTVKRSCDAKPCRCYSGKPTFLRRAFTRGSPRSIANSGELRARPIFAAPRSRIRIINFENQMDFQLSVDGLVDAIEKSQELLMPMPWLAFADHGSFQDIQRSKQCRRPVTLVVVRLPLRQAGT